jgi:uncharacterized protein (DUF58 family)
VKPLRLPRQLKFTREGKYYVALSLGIGFAAINTGNNLLFLVLGMMLSFIVASGILSELSLRALEVRRQVPDRIFAGRPFLMGIGLRNGKRSFASFSVEVEDLIEGRSLEKKCYFLKVPAGRTQQTSYRHRFDRRGLYRLSGCRISTKFPFALFRKSRIHDSPTEVLVFPSIHAVLPPPGRAVQPGEAVQGRLDRRGEFHALREYASGDDPRSIHWRKSATAGRLMVRQNEDQLARRIAVILDNAQRADQIDPAELERQELAVSHAASLAAHYIQRGYSVRLLTRTDTVPAGAGEAHLTRILRTLALLEFTDEDRALPQHARGESIWVSTTGASTAGLVRPSHA